MKQADKVRALLLAAAVAASVLVTVTYWSEPRLPGDDSQYATMAYNLVQNGVISTDVREGDEPLTPTYRREPLFPLVLATALALWPGEDLERDGYRCVSDGTDCPGLKIYLKSVNVFLHLALVFTTLWAALALTRDRTLAFVAGATIALYSGFISASDRVLPETLAALLFLATSVTLHLAFHGHRRTAAAIGSGVALGLLILSKAVFYYLWLAGAAYLLCAVLLRRALPSGMRDSVGRCALIVIVAAAVIFPWQLRNYRLGGEWVIAGRGGEILGIRAQYDSMPWSDYPLSYLYFTPLIGDGLLKRWFGGEALGRFDRASTKSYYRTAKQGRGVAHELAAREETSLSAASLAVIAANPLKHLALTASFAYRGSFMQAQLAGQPLPSALLFLSALISIPFVPAALLLGVLALRRRDFMLLAFLIPTYYSIAFHSFATHYLPRYSMPLIPVFVILLLVLVRQFRQDVSHGAQP